MKDDKVVRSVQTPKELYERMLAYKQRTGAPVTSIYNIGVEQFLDRIEGGKRDETRTAN